MRGVRSRIAVLSARELMVGGNVGRDPAIEFFKGLSDYINEKTEIYDLEEIRRKTRFSLRVIEPYEGSEVTFDDSCDKCVLIREKKRVIEFRLISSKLIEQSDKVIKLYFGLKEKYEKQKMTIGNSIVTFGDFLKKEIESSDLFLQFINFLDPFIVYNGLMIFLPPRAIMKDMGGILDIFRVIKVKSFGGIFSKVKAPLEILFMMDSKPFEGIPSLSEYRRLVTELSEYLPRKHPGIFIFFNKLLRSGDAVFLGAYPFKRDNDIVYGILTPIKYMFAALNRELNKYPKVF